MTTPTVTVVIPTKNRFELLQATLRTVLAQRGVVTDVVIVDDGSTPEQAAAVAGLAGETVRVIRNEQSSGAASARNQGLIAAVTPWVAFCDDDDLWAPEKLAGQLDALNATPSAWVYTGAVKFEEGPVIWQVMPPPNPDEVSSQLANRNIVPAGASNVMADRLTLLAVGGFDEDLSHLADWDLWLRLLDHGMPAYAPGIGVGYRLHHRAMSLDLRGVLAELDVIDRRWRHIRGGKQLDPGPTHLWIAMNQLRSGRRARALISNLRAVPYRPRAALRGVLRSLHPHPPRPAHTIDNAVGGISRFKRVERVELPDNMMRVLNEFACHAPATGASK
jgi:glycosyltransferase involved in cell wall biosynthesis